MRARENWFLTKTEVNTATVGDELKIYPDRVHNDTNSSFLHTFVNKNQGSIRIVLLVRDRHPLSYLSKYTQFHEIRARFVKILSRENRAIGVYFKELIKSAKRSVKNSTVGDQS